MIVYYNADDKNLHRPHTQLSTPADATDSIKRQPSNNSARPHTDHSTQNSITMYSLTRTRRPTANRLLIY